MQQDMMTLTCVRVCPSNNSVYGPLLFVFIWFHNQHHETK